jgi:NAD(P)-dependent dehydrogenase (short-subunit alcohol dehydrogenase family)
MSKTIIITGANGNLGTAVVKKFLEQQYRVIAVDHADHHLDFASANAFFEWQAIDLSSETDVMAFFEQMVNKYKKIEGALFLAGGFAGGDISATDGEGLRKMYSLNFETAYFLAKPLFSHMLQNEYGRLVFIGARPALKPEQGKNAVAYALSKSLLFRFAEIMNAQAKGKNVVASVVTPSTIDTALNRKSMPDSDFNAWVKPSEIAEVLEFICSDKGMVLREPVYKVYNNS